MLKLALTRKEKTWACTSKAVCVVNVPAEEFLSLTTKDAVHRQMIMDEAKPLATYLARTGGKPAYLRISKGSFRALSHEGRHRAAALIKEGGGVLEVAIFIVCGIGLDIYYDEGDFPGFGKRYFDFRDVPMLFRGELNPRFFWTVDTGGAYNLRDSHGRCL